LDHICKISVNFKLNLCRSWLSFER